MAISRRNVASKVCIKSFPNPDQAEFTQMITAITSNDIQTVLQLIKNQESLNFFVQKGQTYLHLSAYLNKVEITHFLIKGGLKVDSRDIDFLTPLHSACFNNADNVVQLLIDRGADLNSRDRNWLTPLHYCAALNSINCLAYLIKNVVCLDITDINGSTPLHYSAANGYYEITDYLIKAGANPKLEDNYGRTPLHYNVMNPSNSTQIIPLLLDQGVDVNLKDKNGLTPLHIACSSMSINGQKIELLIRYGANVNSIDNDGNTPLHHLFFQRNNHKKICKLLIDQGADVKAKNNLLLTPLHFADSHGPLVETYLKLKLDLDYRDYLGRTPMHICSFRGDSFMIDILIENGADIRARDKFNRTPLHYAVEFSQLKNVLRFIRIDPSLIALVDDNNCNSLHYAAKVDHPDIWKNLIEVYSDFSQKDNFGRSVHFYAAHSASLLKTCLPLPSFLDSYNRNLLFYTLTSSRLSNDNSLEYVLSILNLKLNINQRDTYGRTPLHYAFLLKLDYHAEILLKNFASLYIEDEKGLMPIHYLILTDNNEALTTLIDENLIDLNENRYKICLMQCAAFYGASTCLKILIRNNYKYQSSLTKSLEYSTWKGHVDCLEIILSLMIRTNSIGELYKSCALHLAALRSNFTCFNRLMVNLEKSDIRDEHGRTTMMFALVNCKEKNCCIDSLLRRDDCDLNALDNENQNVLFYSVYYGNLEMIDFFLKRGVNILQKNLSGKTILHLSAIIGNLAIFSILIENLKLKNISYDKLLDNDGFNPLHYACYKGNSGIVRMIIILFAGKPLQVNSLSKINYLHLAAYSGEEKCMELIINEFGQSIINQTDSKGRNALHYLCMSKVDQTTANQGQEQLDNSSAQSNQQATQSACAPYSISKFNESISDSDINQKQLAAYKLLINNQIDINCKDKYGKTPLMIALQNDACKLDLCLIDESTIDLTVKDQNGCSALHYASKFKNELAGQKLIEKEPSLVNLIDKNGRTALHIASSHGLFDLTKSLLSSGASCFIQDCDSFTPALSCAKNNDVADCLDLIIEVMIFEKSQNDANISNSIADKESIRCSSPILETRKSLISQRSRRSELNSFEDDLPRQLNRKS